jgi:transcriptional regulator with XRE-family HTH domain
MLADHAELTREHISGIELGKVDVSVRALERIILALGMTLDEFFMGM